jgi:hypothetical protein
MRFAIVLGFIDFPDENRAVAIQPPESQAAVSEFPFSKSLAPL